MSLWRVERAAEYLGIRPKTLYEWVRADRVPYRKIGFNVRFDPEELKAWTAAQAQGPEAGRCAPRRSGDEERRTATRDLREVAGETVDLLQQLERDLGTHLSYPQRRRLEELAERLERAAGRVAEVCAEGAEGGATREADA